ncbi:TonB-dependent receptor [Dysgonomonas sp. GY617]|uniref:TonB-dependent receptor n=1 Tax=Dysgonomonas sp. GY617 TaxID=2780420 RepID=UPI00188408AC|nr:TonB-dependent receptor [Dysgonomonas sp. GY617]MBF0575039.1 TonB-dependent receptor [Dysgonomonas sp. GY617]
MSHRTLLTLVTLLISCHLLYAQKFSIKGSITDFSNKEALIGATIHLHNTNISVSTDKDGNYAINHLSPNTYTLIASYIGYNPAESTITIKDTSVLVNLTLKSKPTSMNEIVVTGTGTEHYLKDAPVQTEVIKGAALKEYAGRDIEDVLGGLSSSLTFNRNDMGSNLQLNGLKNDYILILIDGKRINGDVGGQNDLSRINMHNIDRIEIVKGAVSSLYGSDAIGGVINFISKKNKDKFSASNTTRIGEYGDIDQGNSFSFNHGKWNSTSSFIFNHTDGWRNTTQEWHRNTLYNNSVTKTVNRSTNYTLSQNLSYQVNKNLILTADASFHEKWTYRPTGIPLWRLNDFYYRNQTYATGAKYNLTGKNFLSFDLSYDRYDYYYDYTNREYTDYFDENGNRIVYYPDDRILQTSQRRWLSNSKGVFYLGKKNTLSAGLEYMWDELVSPRRLQGDRSSTYALSPYVQDEWNITDQFNITAGLRLDYNKDFGQTLTPKISAMYKLGDFNLRATYSNGFKAPTIKELYYQYYATIMSKYKAYYGNRDLKPQKSNYYATSIEYHLPKFKASITGFHNSIRDMISLQTIPTSVEDKMQLVEETMQYVNLAKARTYGVDVTFDADLPMNIKIGGGYSYLDAKAQRTDDETSDDYMKYVYMNATSRHNIAFRSSWSHSWQKYKLGVSLNGRYQSKRYYTSDGNTKGFQLWRINTSHSVLNKKKWNLDINLGVDNIFNYVDRTPFGHNRATTSPGRNYYTSVTIKFQNQNK